MIFMPPRHGKSELASKRFPAWFIGRNASKQIITTSAGANLARDFGREVRNIVASSEYGNVFGTRLSTDSRSADRWNTSDGGVYIASGVGGNIIGRGADIALIDDPFSDRKDADSQTIRDSVYNWYRGTLYHRLMPGGAIILIQTRWHEDDLAGRLLEDQEKGGDKWNILELPALNDDETEALWPAWYDVKALQRIKGAIGPREFSALFQQKPQPDDGTYFKADWFNWYDTEPAHMTYIGAADFAVTEGDGDFTEVGVAGISQDDDLYIAPFGAWWYGQTTPDKWIDELINLETRLKPAQWVAEVGTIRRAVEPFIKKRSQERGIYPYVEWLPHIGDKAANARSFQARASQGKVWLPNNEIGQRIFTQLMAFPAGKNDDIVDVLGLMGRLLQSTNTLTIEKAQAETRDRWDKAFDDDEDENWKTV